VTTPSPTTRWREFVYAVRTPDGRLVETADGRRGRVRRKVAAALDTRKGVKARPRQGGPRTADLLAAADREIARRREHDRRPQRTVDNGRSPDSRQVAADSYAARLYGRFTR
jgi:hypothetical protein